jgi:hypothetical protein
VNLLFDPIDEVHTLQMLAVEDIREAILDMKMRAAAWQPRPCPPRGVYRSTWDTGVSLPVLHAPLVPLRPKRGTLRR